MLWSLKLFYTTALHSPIHTHIHALMVGAATQGAILPIRSLSGLSILAKDKLLYEENQTADLVINGQLTLPHEPQPPQ